MKWFGLVFVFCAASCFGLEISHARNVPRFHLDRVLDPEGLSSIDLSCFNSNEPQKDPDCFVRFEKNGKELLSRRFPIDRGREIVQSFMASLPRQWIKTPVVPTLSFPKPKEGSVILWQVGLGKEEARGVLKTSSPSELAWAERLTKVEALLSQQESP